MTRRRWIADEVLDNRAWLRGDHALHLSRVLRARVGQEFDIASGDAVRHGTIVAVNDSAVEFELGEVVIQSEAPDVTLLLAVFKFDRMEWAIEKCTELGISRVAPVVARRTDAHLAQAAAKRVERWRRLAMQASEQSRRASVPTVDDPVRLKREQLTFEGTRILLAETEQQSTIAEALAHEGATGDVVLAVGPEGGWTMEEEQLFDELGWIRASLGTTILRAETAAIAATAVVLHELARNASR